jgi:hypothetical protein
MIYYSQKGDNRVTSIYRLGSPNKSTVKNRYPLPQIEDLLHHLQGTSFFTNMDLTVGYHQVCMQPTDIWK